MNRQIDYTNFNEVHSLEWLETNGLGGYASGTLSGANSRRYHGLLVAATHPPVGRMVLVSKLEERIEQHGQRFELSCNQYPGALHPEGYTHLTNFERQSFPVFTYRAGDVVLQKTIACIQGENTTVIIYEVLDSQGDFTFELLPLYASRDFHGLSHANEYIHSQYLFQDGLFRTVNYDGCPEIFISVPGSHFNENQNWYRNFQYSIEQYRGLDFQEDLYTHGHFTRQLKKGDKLVVILSTEDPTGKDGWRLFEDEHKRRKTLTKNFSYNKSAERLALAADQFIVQRGHLKTVIAGYHWFSDWGRDTMIALPGLCLVTGRFEDAKNILQAFADSVSEGMLPNRFPDYGEAPEYNTIDATLWFFNAIYKYFQYTKDKKFVEQLLPSLNDIIEWHYKGTRYNIKVDSRDELLSGGQAGVQLTWMDARVGDWVVTPRMGKPVEINALWYNALSIMGELCNEVGKPKESSNYVARAKKVHKSFNELFWNERQNALFDCIDEETNHSDIRPNQLYAISLPFPVLEKSKRIKVFKTVSDELLTPRGLRSLSPAYKDYQGVYGGEVWKRDGAYHQGTVWSFLLGPFVDGAMRVLNGYGKTESESIIGKFLEHLDEGCVGSVSEIFDGDAPHSPRGCAAQAWGVAEVLRVIVEHKLFQK